MHCDCTTASKAFTRNKKCFLKCQPHFHEVQSTFTVKALTAELWQSVVDEISQWNFRRTEDSSPHLSWSSSAIHWSLQPLSPSCPSPYICINIFPPSGLLSTLKMQEAHASEMLIKIYQTTWHYITEDNNLQSLLLDHKIFQYFNIFCFLSWIQRCLTNVLIFTKWDNKTTAIATIVNIKPLFWVVGTLKGKWY
jgi:hypothetical protein